MAVGDYALATLPEVRSFLGKKAGDVGDDALVESLIDRVSDLIEVECSRQFLSRAYEQFYDGNGVDDSILLNQAPIISVTGIWDDIDRAFGTTTLVDPADYVIDADMGRIRLIDKSAYAWVNRLAFNRGYQNIKTQYTAGWVIIPKSVVGATCEEVAYRYRKVKEKRHGQSGQSGHGGSRTFYPHRLLPEVMEVCDLFRRDVRQCDPPWSED